jgi:antitoxin VapB
MWSPVEPDRWADLGAKVDTLAEIGRRHGVSTLVLREPATLVWLLGCRVNVPQTLDSACLDVVVDLTTADPRVTIVTNAIEAPRLQDTELGGLDADWVVVPWWESRDGQLPRGQGVGSDRPAAGSVDVSGDLATGRRRLTPSQQTLLRFVCRDTAEAATATARVLTPTTSEYAAAGLFAGELLARGLDPIVLMVGGDSRMAAHRHPLPTASPLGARGMIVACGRRHGLVASVTRIVSFGSVSPTARQTYEALLHVEQAFLDATRVGARLGDVFAAGAGAYPQQGFSDTEWHRHHQGGFSGLQPREFPAQRSSDHILTEGAVVAWNPSAAGWKVEDTTLVLETGPEPLAADGVWPTTVIGDRPRPDVLVL